jgi:hypothetical protein
MSVRDAGGVDGRGTEVKRGVITETGDVVAAVPERAFMPSVQQRPFLARAQRHRRERGTVVGRALISAEVVRARSAWIAGPDTRSFQVTA